MPSFSLILLFSILFFSILVNFSCFGDTILIEEVNNKKKLQNTKYIDNFKQKKYRYSINYGITQGKNEAQRRYAFKPYIDYLSEQAKVNIRLVIMSEYEQLEKDMADGIIHIADFPPLAFVNAKKRLKNKLIYLGTYKQKSAGQIRNHYQGILFSLKSSHIKSLKDLKNKKIAFVEKTSSSGYNYPMALLLKKKIDPDTYFSKIFFAGSHQAVVDAIEKKSADIGATWDGNYNKAIQQKGKIFNIVFKTSHIPNAVMCASYKLSKKIRKRIQAAALKVTLKTKTSDGRFAVAVKRGYPAVGLVKKSQSYYNIVKETDVLLKNYENKKRNSKQK